jgi:AraC family transcriptional activator of tynA and feaB
MTSLIFACDSRDYISRRTEYRGPRGQEYYEGDYQIMPGAEIAVRIEKGLECAFPIFNLQTRSDLLFRRSWTHIRRDKTDVTIIWFVKRGRVAISNHSGRHIIEAGECTITRSLQPFIMENLVDEESMNEVLHVVAPTHMLRSYIPDIIASGSAFSFRKGDCHVAECALSSLYGEGDSVDRRVAEQMIRASLGALGHCMSESVHATPPRTLAEKRLSDILDTTQRNLSNPDLNVAAVARACGISTRYLCAILKSHDIRFSEVLWKSRLERTKAWLKSDNMRHVSITKIAYMAGFKSAAHFSRMFKQVMSVTPGEYRESSEYAVVELPANLESEPQVRRLRGAH